MAFNEQNEEKVRINTCETCIDTTKSDCDGLGCGAKLASMIREQLAEEPYRDCLEVSKTRCLMACTEGCTLVIAQRGKFKYLIGRLTDDPELVEQVLDFAVQYGESEMGVTPNHEWPPRLAQHIIARIPPCEPRNPEWSDLGAHL
jgi:predicted metal-binding protein